MIILGMLLLTKSIFAIMYSLKRYGDETIFNNIFVFEYLNQFCTNNARLLFENERKGIYPYFTNKHCDYLLAD